MTLLRRLVHEVHRRSLWQVLGIYLAGSWVALQVVEQLVSAAGLPLWVQPLSLVLLVIGLPIVMATAFVQEGTPAGGTPPDSPASEPPPGSTTRAERVGAEPGARRTLFTWRNAILGGALAFTLLGLGTVAYLIMRSAGIGPAGTLVAKGIIEERSRIVLADFESDDPSLARAATEAFRIDLSQSRVVRLAESGLITETLRRMDRDPEAVLDDEVAREAARREGIPLVLTGEINRAGTNYLLTADLLLASSGEVLANDRQIADDSTKILDAVDALSRSLRERMGESLRDLSHDPPLERVTTSDFQALESYSEAVRAADVEGNIVRAVDLLEDAIARDSGFAMAHRKLGVAIGNLGFDRARSIAALEAAYRFRDRLTERERHMTEASYHTSVTRDYARAIAAYEALLEREPDHHVALNNLATVIWRRDDVAAMDTVVSLLQRAIATDSSLAHPYDNLVDVHVAAGDIEAASATLEAGTRRLPQSFSLGIVEIEMAALRRDWEEVERLAIAVPDRFRGNPEAVGTDDWNLGLLASTRGRLEEARERIGRSVEALERMGDREPWVVGDLIDLAAIDIVLGGRPERGVAEIERVLSERSADTLPQVNRPDGDLARYYAMAGRLERARASLDRLESLAPAAGTYEDYQVRFARSEIAIAEGDGETAVRALDGVEAENCAVCFVQLARAYDAAGRADSAISAFEGYVTANDTDRWYTDRWWLGTAFERLARLYDETGDLDRAQLYYAMFVELWRDADEVVQARVRAADERLQEILAARG